MPTLCHIHLIKQIEADRATKISYGEEVKARELLVALVPLPHQVRVCQPSRRFTYSVIRLRPRLGNRALSLFAIPFFGRHYRSPTHLADPRACAWGGWSRARVCNARQSWYIDETGVELLQTPGMPSCNSSRRMNDVVLQS